MKKLFLLMLIIPGLLFAGGGEESLEISLAIELDMEAAPECKVMGWELGQWYEDIIIPEFTELTGIPVEIFAIHIDDNTTKKLDAMIMAGLTPNAYTDYAGRVGLYARPGIAAPLNKYIKRDIINQYFQSYRDMFTVDGDLYALPTTSWSTAGLINLDILEAIDMEYILEDGLTYDEVYEAGKAVKALGDDYYGTYLFASQSGGDYWIYSYWLGGHGAKLYNDDGTIGLNTPEGIQALTTLKKFADDGILNPGASGISPGEYLSAFNGGNVLTISGNANMASKKGSRVMVIGTPRAPGVEFAPVATGPDAAMVFNTGTNAEKNAAAKLVELLASAKYQEPKAKIGRYPSMFGVPGSDEVWWKEAVSYMEEHGVMYHGIGGPHYQEIRALWFPMIQAILTDELTVEEAVARFEKEGNEVIAR